MLKRFFSSKEEESKKPGEKEGLLGRLKSGLSKTRQGLVSRVQDLFGRFSSVDEDLYEELEEILIQADVGVETSLDLVEELRERSGEEGIKDTDELYNLFQQILKERFQSSSPLELESGLNILMIVGVNGSGKTTTMAKLASRYKEAGKKVLLVAGDTFRAAAIEQLETWAQRVGVPVVAHQAGADAAAVVYDGIQAARAREVEVLIIDTAGRLQTQKNLMEELKKIRRIINREGEGARVEVLQILDATTGQNALSQARIFDREVDLDGIILTKLDGTAKGGIIISIMDQMGLPIRMIGVGEGADDLQDFNPELFVQALFD